MKIKRWALLASPATLLLAAILHPPHSASAESWLAAASTGGPRFYLAHLLFLAGAVAIIPASWGMAELLARVGVHRGRSAAILTTLGALGLANLVGMDFLVWRMAHTAPDRSELLVLLRDAANNPAVIGPASALLALLVVGTTMFAIELRRADLIGGLAAALLGTGPTLYFVLPVKPVSIAGAGFLLFGLAAVARASSDQGRRVSDAALPAAGRTHVRAPLPLARPRPARGDAT
jgi:hypothetical protein